MTLREIIDAEIAHLDKFVEEHPDVALHVKPVMQAYDDLTKAILHWETERETERE